MTGPREGIPWDADPAAETLEVLLTQAAYRVDGVTDVFAPTTITQAPQIVAALVTGETQRFNRVRVTPTAAGVEIEARIGVHDGASGAAEIARGVADALLDVGATAGEVSVSVQISRIS